MPAAQRDQGDLHACVELHDDGGQDRFLAEVAGRQDRQGGERRRCRYVSMLVIQPWCSQIPTPLMHAAHFAADRPKPCLITTLLLRAESDKADMDVESFSDGYLGGVVIDEGGIAAVGALRQPCRNLQP